MRKVKTTKKSSKKVVKKAVKKTLNQLVYQNMKELSKHCTSKYFNKIESAEEALTDLFSSDKFQKHLKDKCLDGIRAGITETGAMKIELIFNNDKTLATAHDEFNQKISNILDDIIGKLKNTKI